MQGPAPSSPETWDAFFSDFYLRAYAGDEREGEAQAQALGAARLAGCPEGGDLLDVPCGFGRHSVPLARAGFRAVGVDRSEALLAEAGRRAGGERWPKLVRADYRTLPFADESFDAAVNLFTSLGYLATSNARSIRPRASPRRPSR
jgi:SAM-dependent methyltransferase